MATAFLVFAVVDLVVVIVLMIWVELKDLAGRGADRVHAPRSTNYGATWYLRTALKSFDSTTHERSG